MMLKFCHRIGVFLTVSCFFASLVIEAKSPGDADPKLYELTAQIYRVLAKPPAAGNSQADEGKVSRARDSILFDSIGNGVMASPFKDGQSFVPFLIQNSKFKVHSTILAFGPGSTAWDGEPAPQHPLIETLSRPRWQAIEGTTTEITTGLRGVQYFQRDPDEAYALKTDDQFVGLSVRCTVTSGLDPSHPRVSFALSSSSVAEREPLPGASLDVGNPVVRKEEFNTESVVPLNHWCGFLADRDDGSVLMFLTYLKRRGE